jgi:hypothetical protein
MIQFFKDLLFKDLPLKLVSLALAIALWVSVSALIEKSDRARGEKMSSIKEFHGVPVAVVASSGDATGYRVNPALVTVSVRGTPEAIEDLVPASIRAIVDLAYWDRREGLPLAVDISSPPGTARVSISPSEVEVIPPETQDP